MLENMPIHVGQFYVLIDVIVFKIKKDVHVPLVLRRPFLAIVIVIINVKIENNDLIPTGTAIR